MRFCVSCQLVVPHDAVSPPCSPWHLLLFPTMTCRLTGFRTVLHGVVTPLLPVLACTRGIASGCPSGGPLGFHRGGLGGGGCLRGGSGGSPGGLPGGEGRGAEGWGPQISRFSPLPPKFRSFSLLGGRRGAIPEPC